MGPFGGGLHWEGNRNLLLYARVLLRLERAVFGCFLCLTGQPSTHINITHQIWPTWKHEPREEGASLCGPLRAAPGTRPVGPVHAMCRHCCTNYAWLPNGHQLLHQQLHQHHCVMQQSLALTHFMPPTRSRLCYPSCANTAHTLQKQHKPAYIEISCNLAGLKHPSFPDPPIPISTAYLPTNMASCTGAVSEAVTVSKASLPLAMLSFP